MPEVLLDCGPIDYSDTGGHLPPVVLVGGLVIGTSMWDRVVTDLRRDFRCIVPALPWGAHRLPMDRNADLSLPGQARILADFIKHLDLSDVTLVESDSAMAQVLLTTNPDRVGRVVFCSCETWDNYPPGLPGRSAAMAGKLPGGVNMAVQPMRLGVFRRSPMGFGWMAKRPVPDDVVDAWLAPVLTKRAIRRDLAKYLRSLRTSKRALKEATDRLDSLELPALVVWATEDRVMPIAKGRRLADALRSARLVEIEDSYTLIPLDQPERLSAEIRAFVGLLSAAVEADSKGVDLT